jgi:hypothetical protein
VGFEDAALERLRRYRNEADASLAYLRESEKAAKVFSERLFGGLRYTASLAREAGFEIEAAKGDSSLLLRVSGASGGDSESAEVFFALLPGAAAETDEDLMHEELSRYSLEPDGYSGRVLGWTPVAGEEPCQTFAVYRDGTWKTKGLFVAKARGRLDDPDEVTNGFCLRIIGRLIDLAALTGGAARSWSGEASYTRRDLEEGRDSPKSFRFPR